MIGPVLIMKKTLVRRDTRERAFTHSLSLSSLDLPPLHPPSHMFTWSEGSIWIPGNDSSYNYCADTLTWTWQPPECDKQFFVVEISLWYFIMAS